MSALANLKLVNAKRPARLSPALLRRNNVAKRIFEQIELAKSKQEGKAFSPTRLRTVKEAETGLTKTVSVPKRVKEWWFTSDSGKLCVSLRYGAKVIEIAKGKTAVEMAGEKELVATLEVLKQVVESGELDAQIESASRNVKLDLKK
jgi:hypothetical protein